MVGKDAGLVGGLLARLLSSAISIRELFTWLMTFHTVASLFSGPGLSAGSVCLLPGVCWTAGCWVAVHRFQSSRLEVTGEAPRSEPRQRQQTPRKTNRSSCLLSLCKRQPPDQPSSQSELYNNNNSNNDDDDDNKSWGCQAWLKYGSRNVVWPTLLNNRCCCRLLLAGACSSTVGRGSTSMWHEKQRSTRALSIPVRGSFVRSFVRACVRLACASALCLQHNVR